MNKAISKAVMSRRRLRNNKKIDLQKINWLAIARETTACRRGTITRKSKRNYYSSLGNSNVTDNKLLWKTVKPFFSDKGPIRQKIKLTEIDRILGNIKEISEIFNNFFSSIVPRLNIPKYEDLNSVSK